MIRIPVDRAPNSTHALCPKCGNRGLGSHTLTSSNGPPDFSKYTCKACDHIWNVAVEGNVLHCPTCSYRYFDFELDSSNSALLSCMYAHEWQLYWT